MEGLFQASGSQPEVSPTAMRSEASVATDDRAIVLGTQHNIVKDHG